MRVGLENHPLSWRISCVLRRRDCRFAKAGLPVCESGTAGLRKRGLEVREECHYLTGDLATGAIRSDRAGLRSIPGEEYTTILPG